MAHRDAEMFKMLADQASYRSPHSGQRGNRVKFYERHRSGGNQGLVGPQDLEAVIPRGSAFMGESVLPAAVELTEVPPQQPDLSSGPRAV